MVYPYNGMLFGNRKEILIHATIWTNLENIMPEMVTYCTVPFIKNIWDRETSKDKKPLSGCQGLGKGKNGRMTANGHGVSFRRKENVLQ